MSRIRLFQLMEDLMQRTSRTVMVVTLPLSAIVALALSQVALLQWTALGVAGLLVIALAVGSKLV